MKTETVYYRIVAGPSENEMCRVTKGRFLMFKVMKSRLIQEPDCWADALREPVDVWLKVMDWAANTEGYILKGELPVDAPWGELREEFTDGLKMVHWCEGEIVIATYNSKTGTGTIGALSPHVVPLSETTNMYIDVCMDELSTQTETIIGHEQAEFTAFALKRDEFSAWLWEAYLPLNLVEIITRAFEELETVYDITHELMDQFELHEDEWLEALELQSIVARYLPDEAVDEPDLVEYKLIISLYGELVACLAEM